MVPMYSLFHQNNSKQAGSNQNVEVSAKGTLHFNHSGQPLRSWIRTFLRNLSNMQVNICLDICSSTAFFPGGTKKKKKNQNNQQPVLPLLYSVRYHKCNIPPRSLQSSIESWLTFLVLHLHCCSSVLFLMYFHFLCKQKSLRLLAEKLCSFPVQSTVTFLSSKQAPDKAVLRPVWWEAAGPGCAIPSPQVLQICCRAACCREVREMTSSLLIQWTPHKWKQPQLSKQLMQPTYPFLPGIFFHLPPNHLGQAQTPNNTQ